MMRTGGTESMAPDTFDEEAAFLAANISSFGGDSQAGASLGCITPALDACLELFFDMLRNPRFDEARLQIEKGNILEVDAPRETMTPATSSAASGIFFSTARITTQAAA